MKPWVQANEGLPQDGAARASPRARSGTRLAHEVNARPTRGEYPRLEASVMHPDTPASNLTGFRHMTAVLSFCANKPLNVGGGYRF